MPDDGGVIYKAQLQAAVAVCSECPVVNECRDFAISENITVGIYGGLSNKGRREFVTGKKKVSTNKVRQKSFDEIRHGTLNAYQRHKCRCEPCAEAGLEHSRRGNEIRKAKRKAA